MKRKGHTIKIEQKNQPPGHKFDQVVFVLGIKQNNAVCTGNLNIGAL
jgi:hypothetical protein